MVVLLCVAFRCLPPGVCLNRMIVTNMSFAKDMQNHKTSTFDSWTVAATQALNKYRVNNVTVLELIRFLKRSWFGLKCYL